jgi:endonuclease/exonuclease/phosphatase family metal-dependent hydrolase
MKRDVLFRTPLFLSILVAGFLTGCDNGSQPLTPDLEEDLQVDAKPFRSPVLDPLTVMTRNVYHGGDIGPVLDVGFSDIRLLTDAAAGVWAEIQANDFHERAIALVDEIEAANPDVVGFQELARFLIFGFDMSVDGHYALIGVIDFETILQNELDARGLPYHFAGVQDNTDVKVPVEGMEMGGQFVPTQLVQLNERDGVLVRNDLHVEGVTQGNYEDSNPLGEDPFHHPIDMLRGWIRVDADVDGVPHHFISTHLEIQPFAPVQLLQTDELLTEIADGLDGVTVLLGDFNSDAAGSMGDPSWTPTYQEILDAGFQDAWILAHPGKASEGLTCCQASDLRNPTTDFYQRIDFIFIRTEGTKPPKAQFRGTGPLWPKRPFRGVVNVEIVGDDPYSKTEPSGLWPSDHAGVVADFWMAPGQFKKLK